MKKIEFSLIILFLVGICPNAHFIGEHLSGGFLYVHQRCLLPSTNCIAGMYAHTLTRQGHLKVPDQ